jgi:hypothetical protein
VQTSNTELRRSREKVNLAELSTRSEYQFQANRYSIQHTLCQLIVYFSCLTAPTAFCQVLPPTNNVSPAIRPVSKAASAPAAPPQEQLPKRILGIIPNYRSDPDFKNSKPLSTSNKFGIAVRDSFDPGTFLLSGAFAGISQASNSTPSYGQGLAGYGRYYGSTYGDFMIGNFMTEGVYPSLFHQDPRYFRRGTGSTWSRLRYAVGQIFITHGDNRKTQFNISEIAGNSTAVALSNIYNPDNRTASDAAGRLGIQLGLDMAGNILKEFAPDLHRKLRKDKSKPSSPNPTP